MASADSIRADAVSENISNDVTVSGANQFIIIWMDFNEDVLLNMSRFTYKYLWQNVDTSLNRFTHCTLCYNRVLSLRDCQEKLFIIITDPKKPMIQKDLFVLWGKLLLEPQVTRIYIIQTKLELSFYRYWIQFKQHQIIQFIPNEELLLEQLTNNRNTDTLVIYLETGTSEIFDMNRFNFHKIFTDITECVNYITSNRHQQMVFVINSQNSDVFNYKKATTELFSTKYYIYLFSNLLAIYILTSTDTKQIGMKKNDLFTNFSLFRKQFEEDVSSNSPYLCNNELIYSSTRELLPMSLRNVSKEPFFYHINIIANMPQTLEAKQEMVEECREYYKNEPEELAKIDKFHHEYHEQKLGSAIWWYTQDSFLYRQLNEACRTQDVDLIYTFRNFISDLLEQLQVEYLKFYDDMCGIPIKVYRAQLISIDELNRLRKHLGHYYSTNTFLSTTGDSNVVSAYFTKKSEQPHLTPILFEYNIDTSIESKRPYADIRLLSSKSDEHEVLFCMGTIFQLVCIEQKQTEKEDETYTYWYIKMELIDEKDQMNLQRDLTRLECQFKKTHPLVFLAHLAGKRSPIHNDFSKSERYYRLYLDEVLNNVEQINYKDLIQAYGHLARICRLKDDYAASLEYNENIIKTWLTLPGPLQFEEEEERNAKIITCYLSIVLICERKTFDYDRVIEIYQKLLEYLQNQEYPCLSCLITTFNLMGNLSRKQKRWSTAIAYYKKANALYDKNINYVRRCLEDAEEKLSEIQSRYPEILFLILFLIWYFSYFYRNFSIDTAILWFFTPLSLIQSIIYYLIKKISLQSQWRLLRFINAINKFENRFIIYQFPRRNQRFFSHLYKIIPPFTSFLTQQLIIFINNNMFNYQLYLLIIAIPFLAMFDPMISVVINRSIIILFIARSLSKLNIVQPFILILLYYFCQQYLLFLIFAGFVLFKSDLQLVARQERQIDTWSTYICSTHF